MFSKLLKYAAYFCITLSFFAGVYFSTTDTKVAQGVTFLPFGGQVLGWFPCTCSPSIAVFYRPAEPSATFPGGPLAIAPWTLAFMYYNLITPGVWHLGYYIPGVPACWMYAGWGCFPFPVLGVESMVGTSGAPAP